MDKCSGTDDGDGRFLVPGDFREIQGSMWFHDHRFFFTAENVHKGVFALCNMYSAPDRGREGLNDGFNLQLPSGNALPWGNVDFDVNISISNPAFKPDGQLFFDIFDTDGFLGDMLLVNGSYYPYMEVLPRRYRLRTINASMARFIKLALVVQKASSFAAGTKVPFHFIANDGNFVWGRSGDGDSRDNPGGALLCRMLTERNPTRSAEELQKRIRLSRNVRSCEGYAVTERGGGRFRRA